MKLSTSLKPILFMLIALAPFQLQSDDCPNCDCTHYPIGDPDCVKCCFYQKGTVTSASQTSVTLSPTIPSTEPAEKTFVVRPSTKVNGRVEKGAKATVYYRVRNGQNLATRIDMADALHGLLLPANDPDPPNNCRNIPQQAMKIFLGSVAVWTSGIKLTALNISGQPVVTLQKTKNGLSLTASIFSADGKVVAELVDNEFFVNPQNYFRIERPDTHSLNIYDRQRQKVLDVRYLNPQAMEVMGIFRSSKGNAVFIDQQAIRIGTNTISNTCLGNVGTGIGVE